RIAWKKVWHHVRQLPSHRQGIDPQRLDAAQALLPLLWRIAWKKVWHHVRQLPSHRQGIDPQRLDAAQALL
ncbi:hypothetical protein CP987_19940, partial [Morganella morganii]